MAERNRAAGTRPDDTSEPKPPFEPES
jgi:hypothetical protein